MKSYTKEKLLADIIENTEENPKKDHRDYKYQLKVLQTIFCLQQVSNLIVGGKDDNTEDVRKEIKNLITTNEVLFSYTFYVSSNQVFDYTWNYMRKQLDGYEDFLYNANMFFTFVVRDINALANIPLNIHDMHIVFHKMIDVEISNVGLHIKANFKWDHFHNIVNVGYGYRVSVMIKEYTLIVCDCSYKDEANKLCEKVKEACENFNLKYNENKE